MALAVAIFAACLVASLVFATVTLPVRPLENTEGCLLFEASRIRAGLPLYTDPLAGAYDYGPVPARYYVLYPPLWSSLASLVPGGVAPAAGRAVSALIWYGLLSSIAWNAYRRRRPVGVLFALFVGGVYTLTLYAASARPDALAVALAAFALVRTVRAKDAGPAEVALFTLAAWVKPNVIGLGLGVAARVLSTGRRRGTALVTALFVSAVVFGVVYRVSGGTLWRHLASATLQPLSVRQWIEQISSRAGFFAFPIAFALVSGVRGGQDDEGVRIATVALASSVAWTLLCLAKVGSATCYWMEPCIGALIVTAHAPPPSLSARERAALAIGLPLQALWVGVASVRSSVEAVLSSPPKARALTELRRERRGGSLWLSDDAGIELELDGRLVDTPFQTTQLVRRGRFPEALWIDDVTHPAIAGLVTETDLLERPLVEVDVGHDRYDPALRRALRDEFVLARRVAGFYVYARR
jgi:hypothetical protein